MKDINPLIVGRQKGTRQAVVSYIFDSPDEPVNYHVDLFTQIQVFLTLERFG